MSAAIRATYSPRLTWGRQGRGYTVEVTHHLTNTGCPGDGPHSWCVYAHVFEEHPLYAELKAAAAAGSLSPECLDGAPLHSVFFTTSYLKDKGEAVTFGTDYRHLHDQWFMDHGDPDDVPEVWRDAERLFNWMEQS